MRRRLAPLALALALAVAACGPEPSNTRPGDGPPALAPVPVEGAPQRGPADAWVTIVEFSDFQCPYCEAVQPPLSLLVASHPEDVRLVFRHFPLASHANAHDAAVAAQCAHAQGRFWAVHDALWASASLAEDAALAAAAEAGGVDVAAWEACVAGPDAAAAVDADVALGREHGVPGTPTFFVNGERVVGALDFDELDAIYLAARARAVASGVPRERYYDEVVLGR